MGFGEEVYAIDETTANGGVDYVGWIESAITIGEVNFTNVDTFVSAVLSHIGPRFMSLLHIQVHGSPSGARFGANWVSDTTFPTYRARFARLTSHFSQNAWVDLRACNVGQNLTLMRQFHGLWGVGIVAGRGRQNNVLDMNMGRYQIIHPDGREETSIFCPPWVKYDAGRRMAREITSRL
ncbi:DUF4347 domain-containing protein [Roseospira navarrensis]|uniref:DUF4347 domain-containing protein n=1 Tax=Roseospira navarrensis TaxID=140058 RepID=A0A7X1ZIV0_9PROT|nr:DUF4347 domain-containing protein [Roseospira navarrensis]MQX38237.1 DUF4347 domain-containing protein [Roseospira navarrensis]